MNVEYQISENEKLKNEKTQFNSLLEIKSNTRWTLKDRSCFIVSNDWINKWKQYVEIEGSSFPGPIVSENLLMNPNEYSPNSACKTILKKGIEKDKDFSIIPKELWDFLHNIYGGIPIERNVETIGPNSELLTDLYLIRVKVNA